MKDLVESVLQLEDEIPMETFETISNVNIVVESEFRVESHRLLKENQLINPFELYEKFEYKL